MSSLPLTDEIRTATHLVVRSVLYRLTSSCSPSMGLSVRVKFGDKHSANDGRVTGFIRCTGSGLNPYPLHMRRRSPSLIVQWTVVHNYVSPHFLILATMLVDIIHQSSMNKGLKYVRKCRSPEKQNETRVGLRDVPLLHFTCK